MTDTKKINQRHQCSIHGELDGKGGLEKSE